jgi:predicted transcriptional regulator
MANREPNYWGSWKGRVISAIVRGGEQTWIELLEKTGLNEAALRRVIAELHHAGAIEKTSDSRYRVHRNLYDQYKTFFESNPSADIEKRKDGVLSARFAHTRRSNLFDWIEKWKALKGLDFSLDPKHFFLEGMYLDDLSKSLIKAATSEVLAVNPFVDHCDLSNTLRDASKTARVRLVTRPLEEIGQFLRDKQEYHRTLTEKGVEIIYNKKVHAKLLAVDRAVAVVSSMNFYGSSSGGVSWEAGLVSIDDTVVVSITDSILKLIESPESRRMGSRDSM